MGRISYFFVRIREAGPKLVFAKLDQRAKPYWYWPGYAWARHIGAEGRAVGGGLVAIGAAVREAFRANGIADASYVDRVSARVEDALSGEVSVLGFGRTQAPSGVGWLKDPFHIYEWPLVYFPFCDFVAAGRRCDVKVPWEMSRLQHLVWLAEGATVLSEETGARCRSTALRILRDWRRANPVGYGVNWTCGMEVAIRAINIVLGTTALLDGDDAETLAEVGNCVEEHLCFLERFPEKSDVPGNHLLADLLGEVVARAALFGFGDARTRTAVELFAAECDRQFDADGCHIEHSTVYHRLCMEMIALGLAIGCRGAPAAAALLRATFGRAAEFAAGVASRTGRLPVFGDQDSGFVVWFGESAQQLDGRLMPKSDAADVPQTDIYSFIAALSTLGGGFFPKVPSAPGARLKSGFASLRSRDLVLTLKSGPQGLAGRAPHDHDDALHVCLSVGGTDLLVDAGCHSYTLDPGMRRMALLSSSHNAPRLTDAERFNPVTGSVMPTVRGAPTAKVTFGPQRECTGTLEFGASLRLLRQVKLLAQGASVIAIIRDSWSANTDVPLTICWRFSPAWRLVNLSEQMSGEQAGGNGAITAMLVNRNNTTDHQEQVGLKVVASVEMRVEVARIEFSPDYGALTKCDALLVLLAPSSQGSVRLELSCPFEGGSASTAIHWSP